LVFIIGLGWLFSFVTNSQIVLFVAVFLSISMSVGGYWFSDKIVSKMAHAKPIDEKSHPDLYDIVENLCITAGLPVPDIYMIKEEQPNAFATGRNPENAVLAVTQGLLDRLERAEIEGVVSHELSHIGNRDMLLQTMAVVLAGVIAIASDIFLRSLWFKGSSKKRGGRIILILALIAAILAPIAATMIRLAISRKREFLADASGALLTRYPEGLASALEKISEYPNSLDSAKNATAHLYIQNPFRGKEKKSWFAKLYMTHPPVEERVEALRGMEVK
jgi:heat shock protein HtpX